MLNKIKEYLVKPQLDAPGKNNIWTDNHISKGMLESHLDGDNGGASRPFEFMDKSIEWIYSVAPSDKYKDVLDLGCGPGLYCQRFCDKGYNVTGVDWSKRSINYARENAASSGRKINYVLQNYLTINYENAFDIAVIICYDFCVLSKSDRKIFLDNVYKALKPGGKFIFDVMTPKMRRVESRTWHCNENGGFFSEKPHFLLEAVYQYDDDDKTELHQYVVATNEEVRCYMCPNHYFTKELLMSEILPIGFNMFDFYDDVAGTKYSDTGDTMCGIFTK